MALKHSQVPSKLLSSSTASLPPQEVPVLADGTCMFNSLHCDAIAVNVMPILCNAASAFRPFLIERGFFICTICTVAIEGDRQACISKHF